MVVGDAVIQGYAVVCGWQLADCAVFGNAPSFGCARVIGEAVQALACRTLLVHQAPGGVCVNARDAAVAVQACAAGAIVANTTKLPGVAAAAVVGGRDLAAKSTHQQRAATAQMSRAIVHVLAYTTHTCVIK